MDIEELRQRLLDYYGTAVNSGIENAMSELNEIEDMSDEEIIALKYWADFMSMDRAMMRS